MKPTMAAIRISTATTDRIITRVALLVEVVVFDYWLITLVSVVLMEIIFYPPLLFV